jgi:Fic family protein
LATGYYAFLPARLPPDIEYTPALVNVLSAADAALSELSGVARLIPNPRLLIAPYIRREAVLSSRIEGTLTDLSDLWLEDFRSGQKGEGETDIHEVQNYVRALQYGIQRLAELPLSLRLVREIHQRLMEDVRGSQATPGEFRRSQNWIGPPGSTLVEAQYVPPPPNQLMPILGNWEDFLHNHTGFPDLIQCAVMHEQFEAIHPFLDGNGRVGRLLITLFLLERERLSQPLLYLSSYLEANRQKYYALLQRVRTHGDWDSWIQFFLMGISETARLALRQASQLMDLRERYREQLANQPKAVMLIDELFVNPYITVARAEKLLGVSNPTARRTVEFLQEQGILNEITGRDWGKVYLANAISEAIQNPI